MLLVSLTLVIRYAVKLARVLVVGQSESALTELTAFTVTLYERKSHTDE